MPKLNGTKNQYGLKTHDEFIRDFRIKNIHADEYEFLEEYHGVHNKIKIKHLSCGTEFMVKPNSLLNGSTCKLCQNKDQKEKCKNMGKNNTYSSEEYKKIFLEQSKDEYELLSEYINSKTKITVKCKKCGLIYDVLPTTFRQGYRCKKCSSDNRSSRIFLDKFNEKFKSMRPEKFEQYEILEFTGLNNKAKVKHIPCKTEFIINRSKDLIYSKYVHCPNCKNKTVNCYDNFLSFIEQSGFEKYPKKDNYCFLTEGKIEGCKNINHLIFDIIIYHDKFLLGCIEFDGPQHDKPVYGTEKLKKQIENDKIKNVFCKENKIPLIRISYQEDNNTIKDLIYDFLSSTTKENKFFKLGKNKKFMSIVESEANADSKCK